MPNPSVARLSGVSHRYGATVAVNAVDLEIPADCMAGFIGPDGVGKSTVLALISGARRIQAGSVHALDGSMADPEHRRVVCPRIAYMPQGLGRNLYPTLSVYENLDFFGRLFGHGSRERGERIADLLAATDMTAFASRPAAKLSGGMKQKLGLCCALIHDPDLLILDEPTTGVDPLSRRQFWDLIDRIRARRSGMSVLVATAYMEEAERFDWLVAMHGGRVLSTGSPASLRASTGAGTLEQAFVTMLPEAERGDAAPLEIPPRTSHSGSIAIEASNLTMRFGDFVAVDHVSLRIERGEIFGFLGSNGCGKTTTMKMLTGLLPASEGQAALFGQPMDAGNIATRRRVGYMSQSFSLYTELTVRQNLELHARLFDLPAADLGKRVNAMIARFSLAEYEDHRPESMPLGIRQRLSLAVAVIHSPEMLILDEPTSGVDPVARDAFWRLLADLSRKDGVTIFISTHFMNEAERCDRISLMHAGRVLMQGTPEEIRLARGSATLEDAFVACLKEAASPGTAAAPVAAREAVPEQSPAPVGVARETAPSRPARFSPARLWAYTLRESKEILRDPIRLAFSLFGPVLLMIVFGFGISFDVERLSYAVLDFDRSPESRRYIENYEGSRYFTAQAPLTNHEDLERRMRSGALKVALEIPPGFGRDLRRGRPVEVGAWIDGAMPSRAETSRGYVEAAHQAFLAETAAASGRDVPPPQFNAEVRFRYNPTFESVYAMVPSVIMLLLIYIPSMMTALGVVRERELGSITNLYVTPVTGLEFLLGKQLPYAAIGMVNFVTLLLLGLLLFGVPIKGSLLVLTLGAALYVIATTGLGLLLSTLVSTQVAAIFATGILTMMPAVQFSGMFTPVSSLSGGARLMGLAFPSTYFQSISIGSFTKAVAAPALMLNLLALAIIIVVYITLARVLLRTQEQ